MPDIDGEPQVLLARAVEHSGATWEPEPLDDAWAERARTVAMSRPR